MAWYELVLIAIGLSMDALAVSVCKGISLKEKATFSKCIYVGIWFGFFQALMPTIGYFVGHGFVKYIEKIDHWIAFFLLALIGANMIKEAFQDDEKKVSGSLGFKSMLLLSIATSIDALAAGLSFAFLNVNIWISVLFIGITTFVISAVFVKIGAIFGNKFEKKAEIAGGVILILIGLKILLEHLEIINF